MPTLASSSNFLHIWIKLGVTKLLSYRRSRSSVLASSSSCYVNTQLVDFVLCLLWAEINCNVFLNYVKAWFIQKAWTTWRTYWDRPLWAMDCCYRESCSNVLVSSLSLIPNNMLSTRISSLGKIRFGSSVFNPIRYINLYGFKDSWVREAYWVFAANLNVKKSFGQ